MQVVEHAGQKGCIVLDLAEDKKGQMKSLPGLLLGGEKGERPGGRRPPGPPPHYPTCTSTHQPPTNPQPQPHPACGAVAYQPPSLQPWAWSACSWPLLG